MKEREDNNLNGADKNITPIILWDECIVKEAKPRIRSVTLCDLRPQPGVQNMQIQPAKSLQESELGLKRNELSQDFLQKWSDLIYQQASGPDLLPEIVKQLEHYLTKHPDVAFDQRLSNLVLYFLKNYININPEFVDRPLNERLEDATEMARQFIIATNAAQAPPAKDPE